MKELKEMKWQHDDMERVVWNPVKELKVFISLFNKNCSPPAVESGEGIERVAKFAPPPMNTQVWNPVKELKDIKML